MTEWRFVEIDDLGYRHSEPCQNMGCGASPRYIHILERRADGKRLRVGCVCSDKLTRESVGTAAQREAAWKREQRKRERIAAAARAEEFARRRWAEREREWAASEEARQARERERAAAEALRAAEAARAQRLAWEAGWPTRVLAGERAIGPDGAEVFFGDAPGKSGVWWHHRKYWEGGYETLADAVSAAHAALYPAAPRSKKPRWHAHAFHEWLYHGVRGCGPFPVAPVAPR
ncbi:MAG: hypothetical protein IPG45_05855 [Deltaproteobacteria bacterium]|nr:hypothetical protein [Deltaproteobacteria bacterium]